MLCQLLNLFSDLRNYNQVLEKVSVGSPVYLTKNGHGCYTIMDINEQEEMYEKAKKYDKLVAEVELMSMLNEVSFLPMKRAGSMKMKC